MKLGTGQTLPWFSVIRLSAPCVLASMCAALVAPVLTLPVRQMRRPAAVHSPLDESDQTLLVRVAAGDRAAFASLFGRFAGRVKSYLIRLGAPGAIAEDLAQDVMVAVWRRAGSYDPSKAKASTWVFVVARNAWIDKLRREKVELAYRSGLDVSEESDEEAPDEAAVRTQTEARMRAALETLSDDQKQVVQLSFFEDRAHSEIAEHLSLPLGTVKSRLRLALIKLRAQWSALE
jgi:RNA polymerase sigma-70 factor (ECF subfamily)